MRASLIVMRLANMRRIHPRQDNSRSCSRCSERVGIYPSGQQVLRHMPDAEIVCDVCYQAPQEAPDMVMLAPGALREGSESVEQKEAPDE